MLTSALPPEVLCLVLSYLDVDDLLRTQEVCKALQDVVAPPDSPIWRWWLERNQFLLPTTEDTACEAHLSLVKQCAVYHYFNRRTLLSQKLDQYYGDMLTPTALSIFVQTVQRVMGGSPLFFSLRSPINLKPLSLSGQLDAMRIIMEGPYWRPLMLAVGSRLYPSNMDFIGALPTNCLVEKGFDMQVNRYLRPSEFLRGWISLLSTPEPSSTVAFAKNHINPQLAWLVLWQAVQSLYMDSTMRIECATSLGDFEESADADKGDGDTPAEEMSFNFLEEWMEKACREQQWQFLEMKANFFTSAFARRTNTAPEGSDLFLGWEEYLQWGNAYEARGGRDMCWVAFSAVRNVFHFYLLR